MQEWGFLRVTFVCNWFKIHLHSEFSEKKLKDISCPWLVSSPPKSVSFLFWKYTVKQVLKLFSGRNNSLKPPYFGFYDNLPYDLGESIDSRALISWIFCIQKCKKFLPTFVLFAFLSSWTYELLWYIFLFPNIITGRVLNC